MPADHVRGGPDAPIENFSIRIARTHTNDYQLGARTTEMYRSIPERLEPATDEGQEPIAAALATLVNDGTLETVEKRDDLLPIRRVIHSSQRAYVSSGLPQRVWPYLNPQSVIGSGGRADYRGCIIKDYRPCGTCIQ